MKETLSDEEISHPLNESLLQEADAIKAERNILKARLEKLEQTTKDVNSPVFKKVRSDYLSKLDKTSEKLASLRSGLNKELKILHEKIDLIDTNVNFHQEKIEESELRFAVEELEEGQHKDLIKSETNEIEKLETAKKVLLEAIERHQKIFEGEEFLKEAKETPVKKKKAEPDQGTPITKMPPEEDGGTDRIPTQVFGNETGEIIPVPMKKTPELQVYEGARLVQTVPVDKTVVIGRSPSCDIILKELKVSRKHAEIQCLSSHKYVLIDLESSNGTFVGGKRTTEQTLQPNDEITIGNTRMLFKT